MIYGIFYPVIAGFQKSDSLPTVNKLRESRIRITDWWQEAWLDDDRQRSRFFAEANLALPGLSTSNTSIDDLFGSARPSAQPLERNAAIGGVGVNG